MSASDRGPAPGRRVYRVFLAVMLGVGAISTTGLLMARLRPGIDPRKDAPPEALPKEYQEFAARYFPSWPAGRKPELVIVFSGQQHNYEAPCGCTEPQYGGLERRYNFFAQLRGFGLKTVGLDLGDIYLPGKLPDQARLKYATSMKALDLMKYDAVNVGPEEIRIPLIDALAETVLNNNYSFEILAAAISNKDAFPGQNGSMLHDYRVIEPRDGGPKVGVIGTLGKSVIDDLKKKDPSLDPKPDPATGKTPSAPVVFERNLVAIPAALKAMKGGNPDLKVLLYQGSTDEATLLAQEIDEFDVILCRSEESEPRGAARVPAAQGKKAPRALLAYVGQKGRYVGVLGVFRNDKGGFDLKWEPLRLGPEFRIDEKRAEHPIIQLLETYTRKMKDEDYLDKYPKLSHPLEAQFPNQNLRYVGAEACKQCHASEYETWDESKHRQGYETLFEHPRSHPPHNRQFDGECVICHATGFGYKTGFRDRGSGFTTAEKSKHLMGVGCETCHGPGGLHVDNPKKKEFQALMSPWKDKPEDHLTFRAIKEGKTPEEEKMIPAAEQQVADKVFRWCFHCHDTDNDHNFTLEGRWKSIAHGKGPTVKKK